MSGEPVPATDAAHDVEALVRAGWRLISLETFEEERALRVLERVSTRLERPLVCWSIASGLSGLSAPAASLDAALQAIAGHESPALFVFHDAAPSLDDPLTTRRLRELLPRFSKRRQSAVIVGPRSALPLAFERETGVVELPLPRANELESLFRRVLESLSKSARDDESLLRAARAALGLTSGEAQRVVRKAVASAGELDEVAIGAIVREKRLALRRTPALEFVDTEAGLDAVGGLGELKRWLGERRRAFGESARRFGLPAPRGLLLLGVQGCGKSLCARSVAREWQFPLLRFDLAAAFGASGRSVESTVHEAIAVAEALSPAVLWIDEIEKGFAASGSDPRTSRVFGSFLTWMSEKRSPVFVAATANDVSSLPPELLRRGRFDELFFVDLPTPAERVEILAIHLRRHGRDPAQFPLDDLALGADRLSGAEIEQSIVAALYAAFAEHRDLEPRDLECAIHETVPLYETFEERIKELRDWARHRARPATLDARMVDLFQRV